MRKISLKRLLVAALFSLLIGVMFVGCGKEETQEDEYEEDADEEEKKEKKKKKKDREEKEEEEEQEQPVEYETIIEYVEKTDIQKYWNGDWYGYMFIDSCDGAYEGNKNATWDACATIELDENGDGTIRAWYATSDEGADGGSYDKPVVYGEINVSMENGEGANGTGLSKSGWVFVDEPEGEVFGGEWVMAPNSPDSYYEDMFSFSSTYADDTGSMTLKVVLRPWGCLWDEETNNLRDIMYTFDSWYLPKINAGMAMPQDFYSEPDKTMEERKAELLAPIEKEVTVVKGSVPENGTDTENDTKTDAGTEEGNEAAGSGEVTEQFDGITPSGDSYTWGNITVTVPSGFTTKNGNIGAEDNKDALQLWAGTKYFIITKKDLEAAKNDIEINKGLNNAVDAAFAVNGVTWTGMKYEYSGTPVWQAYASVNGSVYEVNCYGYGYDSSEALTVLSSLK